MSHLEYPPMYADQVVKPTRILGSVVVTLAVCVAHGDRPAEQLVTHTWYVVPPLRAPVDASGPWLVTRLALVAEPRSQVAVAPHAMLESEATLVVQVAENEEQVGVRTRFVMIGAAPTPAAPLDPAAGWTAVSVLLLPQAAMIGPATTTATATSSARVFIVSPSRLKPAPARFSHCTGFRRTRLPK
jgi:hypothetical protein